MVNITGADQIPELNNILTMFGGVAVIICIGFLIFIIYTLIRTLGE